MAVWVAILKILKPHLLPNLKLDWVQTWREVLEPHGDLELLKSFRSDIQDGQHVSHLENLQTTSPSAFLKVFNCYLLPNSVGWNGNLVEGIGSAWSFRIAKMVLFWYPRWPLWQPSWKSSDHICYRTVIWLSLNMMGGTEVLWKFRIAIILLFQCSTWPFKPHLLPNSKSGWAETWWAVSGWHGDSELPKHSVPISKMAATMAVLKLFKQHEILNC